MKFKHLGFILLMISLSSFILVKTFIFLMFVIPFLLKIKYFVQLSLLILITKDRSLKISKDECLSRWTIYLDKFGLLSLIINKKSKEEKRSL